MGVGASVGALEHPFHHPDDSPLPHSAVLARTPTHLVPRPGTAFPPLGLLWRSRGSKQHQKKENAPLPPAPRSVDSQKKRPCLEMVVTGPKLDKSRRLRSRPPALIAKDTKVCKGPGCKSMARRACLRCQMVRSRGEAASLLQRRPAVYLRAGTRREGHADARHTRQLVRLAVGQ